MPKRFGGGGCPLYSGLRGLSDLLFWRTIRCQQGKLEAESAMYLLRGKRQLV